MFGELSHFSNFGSKYVDIIAPGECIELSGGYEMTGTAAAASFVAAVIAVMLQAFPKLRKNSSAIISRLFDSRAKLEGKVSRLNPSHALRVELIGLYGVLEDGILSESVAKSVQEFQQSVLDAENLDRNIIQKRYQSFDQQKMFFRFILDELRKYEYASDCLHAISD